MALDPTGGVQVSEMVLGGRELEFYKWDGELQDLLKAVKEKLNQVSTVRRMWRGAKGKYGDSGKPV